MALHVAALTEVGRIFDWRPDPARYCANPATEEFRQSLHRDVARGNPALDRVCVGMPSGPSVMSHQSPLEWMETQLHVWARCDEASLLVLDDAHNLPQDALHTVLALGRLRLDGKPVLRVLLLGQAALGTQLDAPELAPFRADIGPRWHMPLHTPAASAAYVQHRLAEYAGPALPPWTEAAVAEVHARTQGCPACAPPARAGRKTSSAPTTHWTPSTAGWNSRSPPAPWCFRPQDPGTAES